MVPPSYGELVSMIDDAFPNGPMAAPSSTASPEDLYKAASAAHWVARYNIKKNIPPKAWQYSQVAVRIAKRQKYYQLRSEALQDQLCLLPDTPDVPFGPPRLEQCDQILQTADHFQDIQLLALANAARAIIMKQKGLGGSKVYVDRSKECLLDMMKASRLRGKPGQGGLALAATLLITELQEGAWLLMGKSAAERQEAEESLQEALQYCRFVRPALKLHVLAGLADNCELAASGGEAFREKAAEYRRDMFAEMTDQSVEIPGKCAECSKKIDGSKASTPHVGLKAKTVVAPCGHLFHFSCLRRKPDHEGCSICNEPLKSVLLALKASE
ncbi:hypothetical protein ABBQ38_006743 [Trebouxia sp. C0009 RCD-2024]